MAESEAERHDSDELGLPGGDPPETGMFSEVGPSGEAELGSLAEEEPKSEPAAVEAGQAEPQKDETEEGPAEKKRGLLKVLSNADPYTVMLGLALLAILTAVGCLFAELGRYHFDIGASDYTQRAE